MENPTHSFRETNLVLQLIWESQIKSKTVISWSSWKKKEAFFIIYLVRRHLCFISTYNVLNTLSKYIYFYISKNITSYTFLLAFEIVKSLQCILKQGACLIPALFSKKGDYFDDYDYDQWRKNSGLYCYKIWLWKPNKKWK